MELLLITGLKPALSTEGIKAKPQLLNQRVNEGLY